LDGASLRAGTTCPLSPPTTNADDFFPISTSPLVVDGDTKPATAVPSDMLDHAHILSVREPSLSLVATSLLDDVLSPPPTPTSLVIKTDAVVAVTTSADRIADPPISRPEAGDSLSTFFLMDKTARQAVVEVDGRIYLCSVALLVVFGAASGADTCRVCALDAETDEIHEVLLPSSAVAPTPLPSRTPLTASPLEEAPDETPSPRDFEMSLAAALQVNEGRLVCRAR
jgi:hypothetical protein